MKTNRIRLGLSALFAMASFSLAIAGFTDTMEGTEDEGEVEVNWKACQRWHAYASNQVERVRAAYQACSSNNDCIMVDTSTDCGGTCGEVINRAGVQQMRRVISHLNATVCRDLRRMDCPYGSPACLAVRPVCADGACTSTPL